MDYWTYWDSVARDRFRNERTAHKGSHLLEHDPDDDFGDEPEVQLDPWSLA